MSPTTPTTGNTSTVTVTTTTTTKTTVTPQKIFDSSKANDLRSLAPLTTFPPKLVSHAPTSTSLVQKTPAKSTLRLATLTPRIKLTPKKSPTEPPVKSPPVSPASDRPNALIKQKETLKTSSTSTPTFPTETSVISLSSEEAATPPKATEPAVEKEKAVDNKVSQKPVEKKDEPKKVTEPPVKKPVTSTKTDGVVKEKKDEVATKADSKLDTKASATVKKQVTKTSEKTDKVKKVEEKVAPPKQPINKESKPSKNVNDKAKPSNEKEPNKKETKKPAPTPKVKSAPSEKVVTGKKEEEKSKEEQPRPEIKLIIKKDTKTSPKGETKSELKSELKSSPPEKKKPSSTTTKMPVVKREASATPTSSSSESSRIKRQRKGVQPFQSPIPEIENVKKISITLSTPKSPDTNKLILFYKNEFLAVRNAEGGFYLCQALQNVTKRGQKIKIRWLNEEKAGSQIYHFDYLDKTDFECVLTTVELLKTAKSHMKIPNHELERVKHILKNALDVEKGILPKPDLSEENPDGCKLNFS